VNFILGTAGHIDHGKSSLVQRLTGINPDRLPEEKARGVTIELGFAHFDLGKFDIGIVDVPGHADFVNNMVSGVASLDLAIFIVAADDGWMPQSEEHLHILHYLGIKNIIIALTKADLCEDVDFSVEMLRDELSDTSLADCEIVPVSSITGMGIDNLLECIETNLKHIPVNKTSLLPRLSVDRAFSPQGVGTVVTGTLTGGILHTGDHCLCLPEQLPCSLRSIQNHSDKVTSAQAGMRTALNIPDLPLRSKAKPGVRRGSVIVPPNTLLPTCTLDVHIQRQNRNILGQAATARAMKHTETVILHHGSSRTKARVVFIETTQLEPGESTLAQLRLESPIAACVGDHFVLRDGAQQGTLAGGIILDANSQERKFRSAERIEFLNQLTIDTQSHRHLLLCHLNQKFILPATSPVDNSNLPPRGWEPIVSKMSKEKKLIVRGDTLIQKDWWNHALKLCSSFITNWHLNQPDAPSIPFEEWRQQSIQAGIQSDILIYIEQQLLKQDYLKTDAGICHQDHSLSLPQHLEEEANRILSTLADTKLSPPARIDLAPNESAQQALKFLIRSKQITELDPKALLLTDTLLSAKQDVLNFIKTQGQATASEIRQEINTTRKVLMPLLESLDSEGLTIREGDYRRLSS